MKNLKSLFLAVALVAMPFAFTSCGEENEYTATIVVTGVGPNNLVVIENAEEFEISGRVHSPEGSRIESITAHVLYTANGHTHTHLVGRSGASGDNTFQRIGGARNNYNLHFDQDHAFAAYIGRENLRLRITAQVENGRLSERVLTINYAGDIVEPEYLSDPYRFTLGRPGNAANPESRFGIAWTSNLGDAVTARFTAQHIVLTQAQFNAIETVEELAAAATGTFATTFDVQSNANFTPQFLIVQDGGTLRLVHMTALNFVPGANVATFTERH